MQIECFAHPRVLVSGSFFAIEECVAETPYKSPVSTVARLQLSLLTIVALWSIAGWNYAKLRDPLYPPFIQSALWATVCTLYLIWDSELLPISTFTQVIFVLGAVSFSAGGATVTFGYKPNYEPMASPLTRQTNIYLWLLLLLSWGLIFPYYDRAEELAAIGVGETPLIALRSALSVDGEGFGIVAYALPGSLFCTIGHLYFGKAIGAFRAIAATVPTLAYASMFAGRTLLFTTLVAGLAVLAITRRIRARNALLLFVTIGIAVFVAIGIALNKAGSYDQTALENVPEILDAMRIYLLGGAPAFDILQENTNHLGWGINTFRSVFALAKSLGISNAEVVPLVKEFVFVPVPTNVYTIYQPYYEDFGLAGALAILFGLGYVHSLTYRFSSSRSRTAFWAIAYSLMMYPLFMQFFHDQYFSLLSFWGQLAAFLLVLIVTDRSTLGREQFRPSM